MMHSKSCRILIRSEINVSRLKMKNRCYFILKIRTWQISKNVKIQRLKGFPSFLKVITNFLQIYVDLFVIEINVEKHLKKARHFRINLNLILVEYSLFSKIRQSHKTSQIKNGGMGDKIRFLQCLNNPLCWNPPRPP